MVSDLLILCMSFVSSRRCHHIWVLHHWSWPVFVRCHLVPLWIWRLCSAARCHGKKFHPSWPTLTLRSRRLLSLFLAYNNTGTARLRWIVSVAVVKKGVWYRILSGLDETITERNYVYWLYSLLSSLSGIKPWWDFKVAYELISYLTMGFLPSLQASVNCRSRKQRISKDSRCALQHGKSQESRNWGHCVKRISVISVIRKRLSIKKKDWQNKWSYSHSQPMKKSKGNLKRRRIWWVYCENLPWK